MQEGVVIFSQKDVDTGLMGAMEAYAKELEMSIPDMLRQVFIRRVASDLAHYDLEGVNSVDFYHDKLIASHTDDCGCLTMLSIMADHAKEKMKPKVLGGLQ